MDIDFKEIQTKENPDSIQCLEKKIAACRQCSLWENKHWSHRLDKSVNPCIMWVGLSLKKECKERCMPLSPDTDTGKIIQNIENQHPDMNFYKTNLVKCPPLDVNGKLRYPSKKEIRSCIKHLEKEIQIINPCIVFLLGCMTADAVCSHIGIKPKKWNGFSYHPIFIENTFYVPIHHPSYIHVYQKEKEGEYKNAISCIISKLQTQHT